VVEPTVEPSDPAPPVLVDSSVLLDVLTDDPTWSAWSAANLASLADQVPLVINPVVYAEVSVRFERVEDVEHALSERWLRKEALPWEAAFLAAKAFVRYRRAGGAARSPLPDFFIGAHAAIRGYRLLTRDPRRHRRAFPRLVLVTPPEPRRR
jgi:predicted nucleic acid-binding protein